MTLKIKKLSDAAIIPTRAHEGDAGMDLHSIEDYTLQPLERKLFKTNIAFGIPNGYYGRIADRSGNALKKGLHILGGVVDEIYSGDIGIILLNTSNVPVTINMGDKIAQIIFERYYVFDIEEVAELDITSRNDNGFGSSGN